MSIPQITIRWSGGERTFGAGPPITVGRDVTSMIRLSDDRVSRRHAEVRPTPDGWLLVDVGSTAGLYVGNERVTELIITRPTVVRFGSSSTAEEVGFEAAPSGPAGNGQQVGAGVASAPNQGAVAGTEVVAPVPPVYRPPEPAAAPGPPVQPGSAPHTVHLGGGNQRPGGVLAPNAAIGATEVVDQSLTLQFAGNTMSVYPGRSVALGRDPSCDLRSDNPTISRQHARVYSEAGEWWIEDLGSSRGTYYDGRRITKQKLTGSMAFTLGAEDAGERLVAVAAGEAPKSLSRTLRRGNGIAVVAVSVIGAVVVLGLAYLLIDRIGGGGGGEPDIAALRAASVYIEAGGAAGSGSIIDGERGLILTNAHVVQPDAPGQGVLYPDDAFGLPESPDEVLIALSQEADQPAEPTYFGTVEVYDGYLDLAIVRIDRTMGGRLVEPGDLDLPSVEIGDSEQLDQDDRLTVFGYPGISATNSSNKVDGSVSSFVPDRRLGTNRAWINSDVRINRGDSGGLAADENGRLVAIPTMKDMDEVDSISRLRPIHLAQPLIDAAIEGRPYVSPYLVDADEETISNVGYATDGEPFATSCRDRAADGWSSDTLSLMFDYDKFPAGHQDVLVTVEGDGRLIGRIASGDNYPVEWEKKGCGVVSVPLIRSLDSVDEVTIYIDAGPNYERPLYGETITLGGG